VVSHCRPAPTSLKTKKEKKNQFRSTRFVSWAARNYVNTLPCLEESSLVYIKEDPSPFY